jgi:uncharacterized UBP type Zn finger protein
MRCNRVTNETFRETGIQNLLTELEEKAISMVSTCKQVGCNKDTKKGIRIKT